MACNSFFLNIGPQSTLGNSNMWELNFNNLYTEWVMKHKEYSVLMYLKQTAKIKNRMFSVRRICNIELIHVKRFVCVMKEIFLVSESYILRPHWDQL